MDNPSSDFEDLLACLNALGVRAIVVGGHALAFHGHPRFTKDLDVLVEPTEENAARLMTALASCERRPVRRSGCKITRREWGQRPSF